MTDIDYAHTRDAERHREDKAKTLARHLYDQLVDADEVATFTATQRRDTCRAAGVNPPGSRETWQQVTDLLRARATWDTARPAVEDPAVDGTPAGDPPPVLTVAPDLPLDLPCTMPRGIDGPCGATPTRRFLPGLRCAIHTPAAFAGHPEAGPDPTRTLTALRIAAGIPANPLPPLATSAVIDMNAVASGKRRSSPHTYRAARDAKRGTRRAG